MARSIRSCAPALAAAVALLALPAAGAEPRLDPRSEALRSIDATAEAAELPFRVAFSLEAAREAYLKVSPAPGNPVFANGTVDGEGWWTEVALDGPAGRLFEGRTAGDPPLDLGALQANTTYNLTLVVHAPAGALAKPGLLSFEYILAERHAGSSGSGGVLDESAGIHLAAEVVGDAPAGPAGQPKETLSPLPWVLAGAVAFVALVAVAVYAAMHRRR